MPAVLAPLLSDGPIIVLVLIVLSRVPPWWIQLLRFAGGFFILYLAAGALRFWRHPEAVAVSDHPDRRGVFRRAPEPAESIPLCVLGFSRRAAAVVRVALNACQRDRFSGGVLRRDGGEYGGDHPAVRMRREKGRAVEPASVRRLGVRTGRFRAVSNRAGDYELALAGLR